jgi:hypothetical protein
MPEAHAKVSPSALPSLALCPGRLRMVQQLPEEQRNPSTQASEDGTRRHGYLEQLNKGETPNYATPEDKRLVELAWPYFRDHPARNNPDALWAPEQRVEIGQHLGVGEGVCWGTADLVAAHKETLEIVDAKFGRWPVSPDSLQLKGYAFGSGRLLLDDKGNWLPKHQQTKFVKLTIVQPQAKQIVTSTEPLPIGEVFPLWRAELKELVTSVLDPEAPLNPSQEACKFCSAKPICPAFAEQAQQDIRTMFQPVSIPDNVPELPPDVSVVDHVTPHSEELDLLRIAEKYMSQSPEELTEDQLGRALDLAPMVQEWFKECEKLAAKRLKEGQPVGGWKLVEGRGSREWKGTEDDVVLQLKKLGIKVGDIYTRKLVSPAQAEKLPAFTASKTKAQKLVPLIARKDGKPQLAPESDPRPGVDALHGVFEKVDRIHDEAIAKVEEDPSQPDDEPWPAYDWI